VLLSAGVSPALSSTSAASCSLTPNAGVTCTEMPGCPAATSETMRGMSRVECLPGDSMYGKATISVAPAATHDANPSAIVGAASSMCAIRTTTPSPAIRCTSSPTDSSIWFAASRTDP
jgi:hypothetical protein